MAEIILLATAQSKLWGMANIPQLFMQMQSLQQLIYRQGNSSRIRLLRYKFFQVNRGSNLIKPFVSLHSKQTNTLFKQFAVQ